MAKHLPDNVVVILRDALSAQDISTARAAKALGVSRSHLSQMLNHHLPMSRVYGLALRQHIHDVANKRKRAGLP